MARVLFVDDEPHVLEGLRRALHSVRGEIEAEYAEGGPAALAALARSDFDVVVTDMRMPGMDGIALLEEVEERYPHVARVVLSGYAEHQLLVRAVGLAHQCLTKPCDPQLLLAAIRGSLHLHELLGNDRLRRLIAMMPSLPSLPEAYFELLAEVRRPEPSMERIGQIIARDLPMTAKIVQLANSAHFGLAHKVTTPTEAATYLGTRSIQALVLSTHVFSYFEHTHLGGIDLPKLWEHSLRVGSWAAAICAAEALPHDGQVDALLGGVLHDLGRVVLVANVAETYARARDAVRDEGCTLLEAERECVGATHAEVGAYLLALWGLPPAVVETIAYHHEPSQAGAAIARPLAAVHVADALFYELCGAEEARPSAPLDQAWLEGYRGADTLERWREACLHAAERVTEE
jgi:HD-like signal output (HDOD) protein/CheY-like chemotaxis protein